MRKRGRDAGSPFGTRWRRKNGDAMRLVACFLCIAFASAAIPAVERWNPENNLLWVANGMLLAYLLLAPRWRWAAYLATGFLALSVRMMFLPARAEEFLLYNVLDMVEVGTAALLLRRRSTELPRFTERPYLMRFIVFAVLFAPGLAGAIYASVTRLLPLPATAHPFLNWMASDSLGMAIGAPAFAAVFRTRWRNAVNWRGYWMYSGLAVGLSFAAFSQSRVPLVYLVYPLLVLVLVRLGLGFASLSALFVTAIAGWLTIHGSGPFANPDVAHPAQPALQLQLVIASAMVLIYSVSVVLEKQRSSETRLAKIASLHELVTENSRDAIILADFSGNRSYVSAAAERLVGWPPGEFAQVKSLSLLHPDDLPKAEATVRALREGAEGAMIECRVRTYMGNYIWVEASLRIVRETKAGAPSGILNIVRDVTERKVAEKQLQDAYHAVETLAATDPLTGLANRRRFDLVLNSEWRRGLRDHTPLSLLMIDADLFKSYNDTYGHPRGDSCLKQIAEAAQDVIARPGDMVARFGGEEFAVILPNTSREGALELGRKICEAMEDRKLPHSGNPIGFVTVSVGCATMAPLFGRHAVTLIELADEALYTAKRRGRNRACDGESIPVEKTESQPAN